MDLLSLLIGAAISWVIAHLYYHRSSSKAPEWAKPLIKNFKRATERADQAGLLATVAESAAAPQYSFQLVADEDPALALAGLRIEIEKRLVQLAEANDLSIARAGVRQLLHILSKYELLSKQERSVLSDIVGLLNSAVHGGKVDDRLAQWALDTGRRLLVALDHRIEKCP